MINWCIRPLIVLFAWGALLHSVHADALTSEEGRFSVQTPQTPRWSYTWSDPQSNRAWVVTYIADSKPIVSSANREQRYDAAVTAIVKGSKGMLRIQRPLKLGDVTGREVVVQATRDGKEVVTRRQIYLTDNRFYTLVYSGPPGTESQEDVDTFFNSFQLR